MWTPSRRGGTAQLGRYWNALVGGATAEEIARLAEPLPPSVRSTVARVRAARPLTQPDAAFVARLERDVLRAFAGESAGIGSPASAWQATFDDAIPPAGRPIARPAGGGFGRRALAQAVTIALLAVTLLVGYFALGNDPRSADDPPGGTPAGSPTVVARPGAAAGINVADADGSGIVNLSSGVAGDVDPAWSPDGMRIAFASDGAIWVMASDGSGRILIADTPQSDRYPVWSSDGRRLAFVAGATDVYVVDADGTDQIRVGGMVDAVAGDYHIRWPPAWQPGGERLAFVGGARSSPQIIVVRADGTGLVQITALPGGSVAPAWSPDGATIAFVNVQRSNGALYVVSLDGSDPRRLAETGATETPAVPFWSADGSTVLVGGSPQVGVQAVPAEGGEPRSVAAVPAGGSHPTWSPDGERIAFMGANGEPYVVRVDGTGLTRLTELPGDGNRPAWSPDGAKLLFASQEDNVG